VTWNEARKARLTAGDTPIEVRMLDDPDEDGRSLVSTAWGSRHDGNVIACMTFLRCVSLPLQKKAWIGIDIYGL